jgi:site-specific recombinase XerD
MRTLDPIASTTITVFTRHSHECPHSDKPQWKRCNCRKSLYIREGKKTAYLSAGTRSWAEAERVAQSERDKRDPVLIELQKIAEHEAAKKAAYEATQKPLGAALDQWLTGMKSPGATSMAAYESTANKIKRWAARVGVQDVSDVTPAMLDAWRGSWGPKAKDSDDRIALTTQAALLTRIKAFFKWAAAMEYTRKSPAIILKAITPDESQTWPLTPTQFEELLAGTVRLDAEARYESAKVGEQLRAIFLVQRWTGLRIGDVLALPKAALKGNRLFAVIRKKRNRKPLAARVEFIVPDHVVTALTALPGRKEEHPDYFFWSKVCTEEVNTNKWLRKVDRLNDYVSFTGEAGEPLPFRSHMLRDTFAVEMLLAGVPIEHVSKLLTHESVSMTERYYAKWTKRRRQQLEDVAVDAMRRMGAAVTF